MTRPVSGRKFCAGSSVVIRHWRAVPVTTMPSWAMPRSARLAPPAICNWAWTMSMAVTSSVTVCSTWMRGFISMKT